MEPSVAPIPEGFHTITPHLVVHHAERAIIFYKMAFGAKELFRQYGPARQKIVHVDLLIGDSHVFLSDEIAEWGWFSPAHFSGTPCSLFLYVPNVTMSLNQAVGAGAKIKVPLCDTFTGNRYAKVLDPFGHEWSLATRMRYFTPAEVRQGAEENFNKMVWS